MPEVEGDNKEFAVSGVADVTLHFGNVGGKTSADDTATNKYFDNHVTATKFAVRADQTILEVGVNNKTFTDPVTIILNTTHTEKYDTPFVSKIVLRTTSAGTTNIKVRAI